MWLIMRHIKMVQMRVNGNSGGNYDENSGENSQCDGNVQLYSALSRQLHGPFLCNNLVPASYGRILDFCISAFEKSQFLFVHHLRE